MFRNYKTIVSSLFFLSIGIFCVYYTIQKQDIHELVKTIRSVNYIWYIPVLIATLLCHYFRTKRWQLLLQSNNYNSSTFSTYNALMSAYLVNFVTGKLGEIYRCGVLYKKNKIPFSYSLATVFIERVIDVLSLLLLFLLSSILFYSNIIQFTRNYIHPVVSVLFSKMILVVLFIVAILLILLIIFIYREKIRELIKDKLTHFYQGLVSIFQLEQKVLFLFYTILIWLMYLMMTYFWFFAFEDPHLSIGTALLVIVIGGIGRSLPVPAHGLGTYHICATFALTSCAVAAAESTAIPIVIHTGQTLFYMVFGSVSMLLVGFSNMSLKNDL